MAFYAPNRQALLVAWRYLWVAILIVAFLANPKSAVGINNNEAKFYPVRNTKGIIVINTSDEVIKKPESWGCASECKWPINGNIRGEGLGHGQGRNWGRFSWLVFEKFVLRRLYSASEDAALVSIKTGYPFEVNVTRYGLANILGKNIINKRSVWKPRCFWDNRSKLDRFNLYPSAFVSTKLFNGLGEGVCGNSGSFRRSIGSFLIGAVHQSGEHGISNQKRKPNEFRPKFYLVAPILLCVAGYLIAVWGWWNIRFRNPCGWSEVWCGLAILGGCSVSVISGVIFVSRIF